MLGGEVGTLSRRVAASVSGVELQVLDFVFSFGLLTITDLAEMLGI